MLCYVMLCYVMLCYVMLCYVMLTRGTSERTTPPCWELGMGRKYPRGEKAQMPFKKYCFVDR